MGERENSTIRAISWWEVFPWLNIARAFRLAIAGRALILGAMGILLTVIGWSVIGMLFGSGEICTQGLDGVGQCPWKMITEVVPDRPALPYLNDARSPNSFPQIDSPSRVLCNPISGAWAWLTLPAMEGLQQTGFSLRAVLDVVLGGMWSVAVWAFFGAAICRIAAVQLAAEEQVGLGAALRFAFRKWPSYFAAPLFPVVGVALATIPVLVLGWIMRADAGLMLGGVIWPLALAMGFVMAILLLGALFGWPLMWATISTEGTDSFDALSRTYAYTFQRPLHYLFYAIVAGFVGWLGWLLVVNFAAGVIWMGYWAAGWGLGLERLNAIMNAGDTLPGLGASGVTLLQFWTGCVKLLAVGYLFSYLWSASAAIYLLLRRDVDATEMDEVHLDADESEQTFDLPKVATDAAGAPVVEEATDGGNAETKE